MIYNFYTLELVGDSLNLLKLNNEELDSTVSCRLCKIEAEIISEYLQKQEGKIGITKLGNELRYNSNLKKIFSVNFDNSVIIKSTENRRSFIKNFIDAIVDYNNCKIYFLILEGSFGKRSKIVDSTFITIEEISLELKRFYSQFKFKKQDIEVYFIEFKEFSDYYIHEIDDYKNQYSKLIEK